LLDDQPGRETGNGKFEQQPDPTRNALVARFADLVIIVHETDGTETERDEDAGPDEYIAEVHPQEQGQHHRNQDHQSAHGGRSGLLEMGNRSVLADRLALSLPHAQHVDEFGSDKQADEQRCRNGGAGAKAEIPKDIENAFEFKPLGQQIKHQYSPLASAETAEESPR